MNLSKYVCESEPLKNIMINLIGPSGLAAALKYINTELCCYNYVICLSELMLGSNMT